MKPLKPGKCRQDLVLEPVSGKALPVYKGEVLRIRQVAGEQCVDFNCFNLNDHKEYMSVGHMRREGFRVAPGRFLWSNPPRYRPMMKVLSMSPTCVTDTLAARCSAVLFEAHYGIDDHPNCQDTIAEAIGEYGLTPDDVHDSLNLWMNTEVDHIGYYTVWNSGKPNDHIDLLAVMDVLAVPVTCGSGNLWVTSNFCYKPISVQVFEPTAPNGGAGGEGMGGKRQSQDPANAEGFHERDHPHRSGAQGEPGLQAQLCELSDRVEGHRGRVHQRRVQEDLGLPRHPGRHRRRGRAHAVLPLVPGQPQEARVAIVYAQEIARLKGAVMNQYGKCRYDITLQPISGKAIPLYQGEVLRIIQVGGEQCVDFNCFNLHDYKERMSVGHMRVQGIRVREGHIAVSAPPRYRPMLAVIYMSDTCVTDLIGARCDATAGEREYGLVIAPTARTPSAKRSASTA